MTNALPILLPLLPLCGACVVLLMPGDRAGHGLWLLARLIALLCLGLSLALGAETLGGDPARFSTTWFQLQNLTVHIALRADGLAMPFVLATSLVWLVILLTARPLPLAHTREILAALLGLEAAVFGCLLAADFVVLLVCWEATLVPLFFLISSHPDARQQSAGRRSLAAQAAASVGLFAAVVWLVTNPIALPGQDLVLSAAIDDHARSAAVVRETGTWLFAGIFVAGLSRVGVQGIGSSVPPAAAGAVCLALGALGPYLLIRVGVPVLPYAATTAATMTGIVATAAALWVAMRAARQQRLVPLLAGVASARLLVAVAGAASGDEAALAGSLIEAIATPLAVVAALVVAARLPLVLVVAALVGLPPSAGFAAEVLIVGGLARNNPVAAVLAAAAFATLAVTVFAALRRLIAGRTPLAETRTEPSTSGSALLAGATLLAALLGLGLAPMTLANASRAQLTNIAHRIGLNR